VSALSRRSLLRAITRAGVSLPVLGLLRTVAGLGCSRPYSSNTARAERPLASTPTAARRLIVYYFPDGIPEPPDGEPSQWHMAETGKDFTLSTNLQPLAPFRDRCVFFNNLTMGPIGEGAHPEGAMKLLTGTPDPNRNETIQGPSLDQYLGRTIGQDTPFPSIYLGAQATVDSTTSDAFISYPNATHSTAPMDNPFSAYASLFGKGSTVPQTGPNPDDLSLLDTVVADLNDLQAKLGTVEKQKLAAHLDALEQLEKQIKGLGVVSGTSCKSVASTTGALTNDPNWLAAPENFPAILKAETDLMVGAMACGLTRVGVIQASQHTTNLIMSRFADTPFYAPPGPLDMRSHQASHYGDQGAGALFTDYVMQVTWWVEQFAYLLGALRSLPEDGGTMLDHSLVLMCSEISNGSTHSHHNMPFVLAGGGGGAISAGSLGSTYDVGVRNHADLLTSIAIAMGDPATSTGRQGFGQGSTVGGLPGLVG
jgi:hypothetical protein